MGKCNMVILRTWIIRIYEIALQSCNSVFSNLKNNLLGIEGKYNLENIYEYIIKALIHKGKHCGFTLVL